MDQLRQGIGQAAGADIVDEEDGAVFTPGAAAVDNLLAAALHLRVGALDGGEVEILRRGPGGHAGGGAAPQADEHGRPAQHHQGRARREGALGDMIGADVAQAAGDHDRLVVTAQLAAARTGDRLLVGAEIAAQIGPAIFVIKSGSADGALQHDVQGRDDAPRPAMVPFPGPLPAGDTQVGDGKTAQPGLGLGATPGGALVADLTAGPGGGTRVRGDSGGMVVGLHLHEDVDVLGVFAVDPVLGCRHQAPPLPALDDRGIVAVGGKHLVGRLLAGMADHAKQGVALGLAVDDPGGVEDFVPAMLGIGLGKHHQLNIRGIAAQTGEAVDQVVNLVLRQGQAQLAVGLDQGGAPTRQQVHGAAGPRLGLEEEAGGVLLVAQYPLGHAIVEDGHGRPALGMGQGLGWIHVMNNTIAP